ncbi:hypothetical protein V499_01318 [Pseudogymnoascus sp. VKM F-103]|uniref:Mitochondrial import inner membrane translocase subunit TIM50 n=1 Tax=Pseudogymnoascus verrucosus TaxID=342668 RepID=A0A1B8GQ43_9PEZI|nr:mitochondrial inner membrane protein required for protein import [Pseudogymnoascus verrucosus]KFY79732.1 hypothetical protein V499_01318 [Pseudogymnoascus sp. VKM F-103]OBT97959.1 mitochondrial inner membrane protein required for protein import [Pseudogymnoascus verrucosus]
MLSRAVRGSLRAPALRAAPVRFLRPSTALWSRGLADQRPGQPKKPTTQQRPSSELPTKASAGGAAAGANGKASSIEDPDVSSQQPEFETQASPSENAPLNEAASTSGAPQHFKLPDLRGGLPSTLEFESKGSTANESAASALNLTEDPHEATGGGGRGPKGELPASAYVSSSEKKRARVANYLYGSFFATCIAAYVYLGRNWESDEEERQHVDAPSGWSLGLMWARFRARTGDQLSYYSEPTFKKLLPDVDPSFGRPYTLVLSLEDLLIHSEWSREHGWRMAKRPGVDYFLRYLSQYYELVIFTSVPWAIGEPVIKKLDPYHVVTWPLFREATMYRKGEYVKDLSYLNRDLSKVIILDTSKAHTEEQPENAIIMPKWKGDSKDKELVSLIPFLEYIPTMAVPDVRKAIASFEGTHIPTEFAAREAVARKKFMEQIEAEKKKKPKKGGVSFLNSALGIKPQAAFEGEQSASEAFAQGKMLQDQARERGQKNYEALDKMIREEGEKWLKEEAAHEEMAKQEGMKAMKSGLTGFFGVPGDKPNEPSSSSS